MEINSIELNIKMTTCTFYFCLEKIDNMEGSRIILIEQMILIIQMKKLDIIFYKKIKKNEFNQSCLIAINY